LIAIGPSGKGIRIRGLEGPDIAIIRSKIKGNASPRGEFRFVFAATGHVAEPDITAVGIGAHVVRKFIADFAHADAFTAIDNVFFQGVRRQTFKDASFIIFIPIDVHRDVTETFGSVPPASPGLKKLRGQLLLIRVIRFDVVRKRLRQNDREKDKDAQNNGTDNRGFVFGKTPQRVFEERGRLRHHLGIAQDLVLMNQGKIVGLKMDGLFFVVFVQESKIFGHVLILFHFLDPMRIRGSIKP